MKRIIVSLAVDKGSSDRYQRAIKRLRRSVHANSSIDSRFYINKYPDGCPTHQDINYAFKPYIVKLLFDEGYDQVLWIDSAIVVKKDLKPVWDIIDKQGYYLQLNGWTPGEWMTDKSLELMGVTRDAACKMLLCMANVMGFDKNDAICMLYFNRWLKYSKVKDIFSGPWSNKNNECSKDPRCLGHRHDQSVASIIAAQMDFYFTDCSKGLLIYGKPEAKETEGYIFVAAGA